MRKGQNPAKFIKHVARPKRITVAVLNYIPFQSGYYAESLDVLNACINSLHSNTRLPFDLMVFDNGSCHEVVDFLQQAFSVGRIQYLILSEENLGKGGAWNVIFEAAPGEILAYTDSDAYFHSGWLGASVKILEIFPEVGMVTSRPFRTPPELFSKTIEWAEAESDVIIERGQYIPWESFREFDLSLGQSEDEVRERFNSTEDIRLTYRGTTAHVGASHWQFVAWKSVIRQFTPFEMDRPMGQVRELDRMVDQAGLLRLMTSEPLAMNMSNTLQPIPEEDAFHGADVHPRSLGMIILENSFVKRLLLFIYNRIFQWYYSK